MSRSSIIESFSARLSALHGPGGRRSSKRCIGLDIGRSHLRAVQIARTPEGFCVEKAFGVQMRRSTDSLPAIVQSLTAEHGFDRRAEVAVALPHHRFFCSDIQTDAAGLESLKTAGAAALADHFPIPAEDVVAQACSAHRYGDGRYSVLVAATSVESLEEELRLLEDGGVRPQRVDAPFTAAHGALLTNHPKAAQGVAATVYVDESTVSLAVMQDGGVLLVRNIPMAVGEDQDMSSLMQETAEIIGQEIDITWRRLFGSPPGAELRVFLIASQRMSRLLAAAIPEKLNCQTVVVDPYANVRRAPGVDVEFPLSIAEGLALRSLEGEGAHRVDFLPGFRAKTRPALKLHKEAIICGGLATAAAAVWVVGLFLQLSALESDYARLKAQAKEVFRRTVPGEANVVNPAAQLEQKLESFREESELYTGFSPGRARPLEILYALSRHAPADRTLKLEDVLIAGDSVRIIGSCDSFAGLSRWQQQLEDIPGLEITDPPNPKKDSESDRIEFTVSLTSTRGRA